MEEQNSLFSLVEFCSHAAYLLIVTVFHCFLLQLEEFKLYWGADFLRLKEKYWKKPISLATFWSKI